MSTLKTWSMWRSRHISGQLLDLFRIRLLSSGNEGGVDAAGRHAGEDVGNGGWKFARQVAQHPNLVGGARAAATQHQRKAPSISHPHQMLTHPLTRAGRQRLRRAHRPTGHDGCRFATFDWVSVSCSERPASRVDRDPHARAWHRRDHGALHRRQRRAARAAAVSRFEQADPGVAQRTAGADLRLRLLCALSRLAIEPASLHRPRRVVAARRTRSSGRRARSASPGATASASFFKVDGCARRSIGRYFSDDEDRTRRRSRRS